MIPENYRAQAQLGLSFAAPVLSYPSLRSAPVAVASPAARPIVPGAQQNQVPSRWRRTQANGFPSILPEPQSKEFVPELFDYVVQATCKRIRTIPVNKKKNFNFLKILFANRLFLFGRLFCFFCLSILFTLFIFCFFFL